MTTTLWAPAAALLLLLVAAAGTSAEHHGDHGGKMGEASGEKAKTDAEIKSDAHQEEYDKLVDRLNHLTARLVHMDDELDKRLDPETKVKAKSLLHRIEEIEDDTCEKLHFQCGGFEPECVSNLFVCDGVNDCRNGGDEKNCDLPTKHGDAFIGLVVFDHCSQRKPEQMSFTITAVTTTTFYSAFPSVSAIIHIEHEDDLVEGAAALVTKGYYRFATHKLILLPPEEDRLGLICEFDGSNPDRCVGNIVHETSLEPCAQFIFNRQVD